jgi:hypothetical protein
MSAFDWTCPFCNRHATITQESIHAETARLTIANSDGSRALTSIFIVCPNPKCKKFALTQRLTETRYVQNRGWVDAPLIQEWQLIPASKAQAYPDYIPRAIRDDYNEACLIVSLSPKASATLARRSLQGILRDFWGVKPGRLVDEIEQIKGNVDPLTWEAIEAVRKVGNIGAHMEEDINLIVDVEPHEAELLIGLIETLIKDWYITREERRIRLSQISQLAQDKEAAKKDTP